MNCNMMKTYVLGGLVAMAMTAAGARADDLAGGFVDPPTEARPGAYWCWLNGNMSRERITHDLEQMKAKGLGSAEIWDLLALRDPNHVIPAGPAFMGPESVDLIAFAIDEATRLKLRLGLIASSGWNAGGAWVPPKYAGKGLFWSKTDLAGPAKIERKLPFPDAPRAPKNADGLPVFYKEIAVLAVPESRTIKSIDDVLDISRDMDARGNLKWNAPAGKWTIVRFVCTNHGQHLIVPSPNSKGPMIDFIDPNASRFHFNYMMDKILAKLGRKDFRGTAMKYMELDSMELQRGVLWSDHFAGDFKRLRGYSPIRYLPLLAGWKLSDKNKDSRFHYDFRNAISDQLIESHYVTGSEVLGSKGLRLAAEAGGPGPPIWDSCPVDSIKALGAVDIIRGEFWIANRNMFLIKEIASAAHVYGKPIVDAESFTTWRRWIDGPLDFKRIADRAFCEGLNHLTFHTFASSPPEAGVPGWAYHAGSDINATATWWPMARPFMDYLARCSFMLRQGLPVADVCFYYGDQAPNFYPSFHSVPRKIVPEQLGLGYDYDVCDSEVILKRLTVSDGRIVLPEGTRYAVLALPDQDFMPLAVLEKIEKLVAAGATVIGPKPVRSVGLEHAAADAEVKRIADRMWGKCDGKTVRHVRYGKGHIVWGPSWRDVLAYKKIAPDFHVVSDADRDNLDYIHRRATGRDLYFVRNKTADWKTLDVVFRVTGATPQCWNPVTGRCEPCDAVKPADGGTRITLTLPPDGSTFVVFAKDADNALAAERPLGDLSGKTPAEIKGAWKVSFPRPDAKPVSAEFDSLESWTDSGTPYVKYFSGIATYEKAFDVPAATIQNAKSVSLDLGDVKEIAEVFVNGKRAGIVWTPPYRLEVGRYLKPGRNVLTIKVANLWANRIIGDYAYPQGGIFTHTNMKGAFNAKRPLLTSGLLGPVRLYTGQP